MRKLAAPIGWVFLLLPFFCLDPISAFAQLSSGTQTTNRSTRIDSQVLSDRIANYRIEVRLDPETKTIQGHEILVWHNRSKVSLDVFYFHLYLNAFKNNRSTMVQESGFQNLWNVSGEIPDDFWGYVEIDSLKILQHEGSDANRQVVSVNHVQPDDGNRWDQTVLEVKVDKPLPPGEPIHFRIDFTSKLPRGSRRTGWIGDYFFAAQWFPKIGVYENGSWNCHQYHWSTEFFADFGVYDVFLTVPNHFTVGATGKRVDQVRNPDMTITHHYYQEDVHDFAWVASPHFLEKTRLFSFPQLPQVEMTLLLQPEHAHLEERYFAATQHTLRYFGEWFGHYPYDTVTVVDPAYLSSTSGMEYPTFLTGRAYFWSPDTVFSPESVTVHEVGHQWWYGMVANNEFEEAWLDEGITSWATSRVLKQAYGDNRLMQRFFGGIPLVYSSVRIPVETWALPAVRRRGKHDIMARAGWEYMGRPSYLVNSYSKPELVLWTLGRYLGDEVMLKAMRVYFQRYRFKHPTTKDFIETVNEVARRDMTWFFEETFYSSQLVDYAIQAASSSRIPERRGVFEEGKPSLPSFSQEEENMYQTEVVVQRLEGAKFPVEIMMVFENGEKVRREWDGQDRWKKFFVQKSVPLRYAVVDPDRKLLLDINPTNNSRYTKIPQGFALATWKWACMWLFWVQNLLETFTFMA